VKLLQRYVSERGKSFRVASPRCRLRKQRELAQAIKRARFLGLLPYVIQ
jgi:small subunit ribosomal protein S18